MRIDRMLIGDVWVTTEIVKMGCTNLPVGLKFMNVGLDWMGDMVLYVFTDNKGIIDSLVTSRRGSIMPVACRAQRLCWAITDHMIDPERDLPVRLYQRLNDWA